jgi:hypothetical protein
MPIARHIFGRDKPSLTALAHGDGTPVERRRALGLHQLFRPVLMFGSRAGDETAPAGEPVWRLPLALVPIAAGVLVLLMLAWFWI